MRKTSRTRYALLGFLTFGPKTGYDLRKECEERTAHLIQIRARTGLTVSAE